MKAISIKQPWASLIVHGIKYIENRTWKCPEKYIGKRVLIHASINPAVGKWSALNELQISEVCSNGLTGYSFDNLQLGAIIGSIKIVDCVQNHPSVWAEKSSESYNLFCKKQGCNNYIEWNCGYGDCVSCKLQGESYDIKNIDKNCRFKANAPKPIYNWVLAEPILYENPIENIKGKLSFWEYDGIEEVTIECPECGFLQPAVVDCSTAPFIKYIHDCKKCGFLIQESEWNEVKEEE